MAVRADARRIRPHASGNVRTKRKGKLIIFGRPTLMFDNAPTPEEYYKEVYGYDEVHTLDISSYEGASIVHDLNDPNIPDELIGQYDAVSLGGTAEHVANVALVFQKAAMFVKEGGTVIASSPANNWLDHGFWQVSPTFKFDYFQQAGYALGTSIASIYLPGTEGIRRLVPLYPFEAHNLNFLPARISHTLLATKLKTSRSDIVPTQAIYRRKHNNEALCWRFEACAPFDIQHGNRVPPPARRFTMEKAKIVKRENCWAYPFRENGLQPSMPGRPFRSKALIYEDGVLLKWIVSNKRMVAERSGSFHHTGPYIYFNTSDGSDPILNSKIYEAVFPKPFKELEPYTEDDLYKY